MKLRNLFFFAFAALYSLPCPASVEAVTGAGASFPAPLYKLWNYLYFKDTGHKVNYLFGCSGSGLAQMKAETIDFGASDIPTPKQELNQWGAFQFPMIGGGIVVIVNIPGVKPKQLKLDSDVLPEIFIGNITNWNNKRIKALNPGLNLPDLPITIVHRSDSSGTTWIFSNYLSKISINWRKGPGHSQLLKWPSGIGGKNNSGVANSVMKVKGAIGYVEYAYAAEANLCYAQLKNKDGYYVLPSLETFQAACQTYDWKSISTSQAVDLTNTSGKNSWPITGVSYILLRKEQKDLDTAKAMLDYFDWCFKKGVQIAEQLNYVPLPQTMIDKIEATWKKQLTHNGKPIE